MTELPLVSIVTPSYNQGMFIERTILSVQKQDYPRIEHIVVDGGSDDMTLSVLGRYDGRINWISEPDTGQGNAINKGLGRARGEILTWLNSDDVYFYRDSISCVVHAFLREPEAGLVTGSAVLLDEHDLVMQVYRIPSEFSYERLLRYDYVRQPATFFRRAVWQKYQLEEGLECAFDYEYWLRVTKEFRVIHLRDMLAGIRRHDDMKTIRLRRRMAQEADKVQAGYGYSRRDWRGRVSDVLLRAALKCAGITDVAALYARRSSVQHAVEARYDHVLLACMRQLFNRHGFGLRAGSVISGRVD